jgi:hypothetical protein
MVGCLGGVFSVCTLVGAEVVGILGGAIVGSAVVSTLEGSMFCVGTLGGIVDVVMAGVVLIRWNIAASFVTATIVHVETSWKGAGGGGQWTVGSVGFLLGLLPR